MGITHALYFRVDAAAGLAKDNDTGAPAPAFIKTEQEGTRALSESAVESLHELHKNILSSTLSINKDLITAIDREEYEFHTEGDDEE